MVLEVITTSVTDGKLAEQSGADRIELITGFLEGGLTPSFGLVAETVLLPIDPTKVAEAKRILSER